MSVSTLEAMPAAPSEPAELRTTGPKSSRWLLVGIVGLALALRVWGVGWQLPWQLHPDEGHYVWKAVGMTEDGNLNPKYFRNPSLYTYLLLAEYGLLGPLLSPLGALAEALQPPSLYALLGRLTTALLGVGTIVVVARLGALLLGTSAALVGALLLAVSLLHVRDSHYATNDVPATFLLTLSALYSARLSKTGARRDLLLAGLLGGLATSTKYSAGVFLAPLLVGYLLAHGRRAGARGPLLDLLGAGGLAALGYLLGTPFTLLDWPRFSGDFDVQRRFAREGWEGQGPEPVWQLYLQTLGQGLGWLSLAAAVAGAAILARRRSTAALLLGALPLAYFGYMLTVRLFFARFVTLPAPFICLLAGYGVVVIAQALPSNRSRLLAVGLMTALIVAQPLAGSVRHNLLIGQTDTRPLAYAWLVANVPAGARIAADEYTVRDRRPRADLPDRARYDLDLYDPLSKTDLASLRQQRYQYAISSSFQSQRFPGRSNLYAELEREARLLAVFSPTDDGRELPFDIEELYTPFNGLERYARPGPTVKIYALGDR
jgi:4-amino-4-deoxy-L-arabinose transferase-like glycosyltransferase